MKRVKLALLKPVNCESRIGSTGSRGWGRCYDSAAWSSWSLVRPMLWLTMRMERTGLGLAISVGSTRFNCKRCYLSDYPT